MTLEKFKGIAKEGTWNWARYQAEQLGNKIRLSDWGQQEYIYFDGSVNKYYLGHNNTMTHLDPDLLDAEYWEVYDGDADWNLAKHISKEWDVEVTPEEYHFMIGDVKKCRDLITEDLVKETHLSFAKVVKILNKRFGDL